MPCCHAMIGAMVALGCAADLFNLWVWFEAMAVSSYLLVVFLPRAARILEAGVKYLVQSAAGSVLVLLGIAMVLEPDGHYGPIDIRTAAIGALWPCLLAGALFVIGFGVKTALVPMHTWLPDAHLRLPAGSAPCFRGLSSKPAW